MAADEIASLESGTTAAVAAPLPAGAVCPRCSYDLRGLTSDRCPECGFELDVFRTQEPQIPWSRRRELGWFRAYWQTVWLVARYPRQFCLEIVRPVSYRDSQTFRWLTFGWACATLLIDALSESWLPPQRGIGGDPDEPWISAGALVAILLTLAVLPGVASYSFQLRGWSIERQNRAIALSYYAWAPLAAWLLALPFIAATRLGTVLNADPRIPSLFGQIADIGNMVVCVAALLLCLIRTDTFARYILRRGGFAQLWSAARQLAAMAAVVFVLVLVVPAAVWYVLIIFSSLR